MSETNKPKIQNGYQELLCYKLQYLTPEFKSDGDSVDFQSGWTTNETYFEDQFVSNFDKSDISQAAAQRLVEQGMFQRHPHDTVDLNDQMDETIAKVKTGKQMAKTYDAIQKALDKQLAKSKTKLPQYPIVQTKDDVPVQIPGGLKPEDKNLRLTQAERQRALSVGPEKTMSDIGRVKTTFTNELPIGQFKPGSLHYDKVLNPELKNLKNKKIYPAVEKYERIKAAGGDLMPVKNVKKPEKSNDSWADSRINDLL